MARSTTSPKSPKRKPAAADEAEPFGAPVGEIVASLDAEDPEDFAADLIRAVLKWQIEQIQHDFGQAAQRAATKAEAAKATADSECATDLHRFTEDAWRIIHKANQIVEEKVEELAAKDAASIAAGYFDRQAKAHEQLNDSSDTTQEYVAQWDSEKS